MGFTNPRGTGGECDMYLCFVCGGVGGLGQGLVGWGGVKSLFIVSLDFLD